MSVVLAQSDYYKEKCRKKKKLKKETGDLAAHIAIIYQPALGRQFEENFMRCKFWCRNWKTSCGRVMSI